MQEPNRPHLVTNLENQKDCNYIEANSPREPVRFLYASLDAFAEIPGPP